MHIYSGLKKQPFKKTKLLCVCVWGEVTCTGLLFLSLFSLHSFTLQQGA